LYLYFCFKISLQESLLYNHLFKGTENIYNLCHQFKTNNLIKPNLRFRDFYNEFKLKFDVSKTHTQNLESFLADIDFLKENVTPTSTDGHQMKWLHGLDEPLADIKKVVDWYAFIVDSYEKSIDYNSQKLIANNMGDLKMWADFKIMRKELAADAKLNQFFEKRPKISSKEQIDLNNLVESIEPSLEHSCESQKLVVKGNLVELGKVKTDLFPICPSFKELYIFAIQTVFIDESLGEPAKNVYIVAPVWEIVGTHTINLRGKDAVPTNTLEAQNRDDTRKMAGDPGEPGGNFVGIGENFVNGNGLTIDVSGGNGGNGVDGEKGEDGKNCPNGYYSSHVEYGEMQYKDDQSKTKRTDIGPSGKPGSQGGDGGKFGYGAKPGYITVNSPEITQLANVGKNGTDGIGAKGGKGGKHAETRIYKYESTTFLGFHTGWEPVLFSVLDRGRAPDGEDGVTGSAGDPLAAAEPQSFVPLQIVAREYNQYIRQKRSPFVEPLESIKKYIVDNRNRRSVRTIYAAPIINNNNLMPQHLAIGHESGKLENKSWRSDFSLSSFVALADIFIRKLMKIKPTQVKQLGDPNWEDLLVQAEILNIVERCEVKWDEVNQSGGTTMHQKQFDPVCLQRELFRRVKRLTDKSQVLQIEKEIMDYMFF
jgi:hypothetical protein